MLIEEGLQIDRELYLSILIDRASQSPVIIASAAVGMDIEEVAASTPKRSSRSSWTAQRPRALRGERSRLPSAWTARTPEKW